MHCSMVTPSDDNQINPGTHRAYLFKDTFMYSYYGIKYTENAGDRNSGEFTNKLGP